MQLNWAHPCHICTGAGLGARTALRMYVETEPTLSAACQKGPTEGREQPAAGLCRRVLKLIGLGALGAVRPLGSASGAQQARGHPAPASTHARHCPPRPPGLGFALRLPHWQRPWGRTVLNGFLRDTLVSRSFRNLGASGRPFAMRRRRRRPWDPDSESGIWLAGSEFASAAADVAGGPCSCIRRP
jgi:hypothetical protein